jgi:hypothetical protein
VTLARETARRRSCPLRTFSGTSETRAPNKGQPPVFTTLSIDADSPQQGNGNDCGVFTLAFAHAIAERMTLSAVADGLPADALRR